MAIKYLQEHAKGGLVGRRNYILDHSKEEILIFGSSRALHHYNPQIIEDSLGLSCLNCGIEGMGMPMFYGWWTIIKERYKPKLIVYDLTPGYDLYVGEDNHKYLRDLKERYDMPGISDIFERVDKTERIKMMSYMYRYNSVFMQILGDYVHPRVNTGEKGYLPIEEEFDPMLTRQQETNNTSIDSLKSAFVELFIRDIRNERDTKIVIALSPIWYIKPFDNLEWLLKICKENEVPLLDYSMNSRFNLNNSFFRDGVHLNSNGADEYTRELVKEIKPFLDYDEQ